MNYLAKLNDLVGNMLLEPTIIEMISNLKEQLIHSNESYVWSNGREVDAEIEQHEEEVLQEQEEEAGNQGRGKRCLPDDLR